VNSSAFNFREDIYELCWGGMAPGPFAAEERVTNLGNEGKSIAGRRMRRHKFGRKCLKTWRGRAEGGGWEKGHGELNKNGRCNTANRGPISMGGLKCTSNRKIVRSVFWGWGKADNKFY